MDKETLTVEDYSMVTDGCWREISILDDDLYIGGYKWGSSTYIRKYNKNDLSFIDEIELSENWSITIMELAKTFSFEAINKELSDFITFSDDLTFSWVYGRELSDNVLLSDSLSLLRAHTLSLSDTVLLTDISSASEIEISWCYNIVYEDANGNPHGIALRKPYYSGIDFGLGFNQKNFAFRSGHYNAYVEDISDEQLVINGYETSNVVEKFEELVECGDKAYVIIIDGLDDELDGEYVINSISYRPIGINSNKNNDVFEYTLRLKKC